MTRALLLACAIACGTPARPEPRVDQNGSSAPTSRQAIELVESWPVETSLDSELPDAADVWLQMIESARATIELAVFYASNAPDSRLEPIVKALEVAAMARGVRVRVLAEQSFVKVYPETLQRLERAGAVVRHADFKPGVLHAKYFVVDGRTAYLGSQNFDWRSLEHILELGARIRDPQIAGALTAIFELDWATAGNEPVPAHRVAASTRPVTLVASPKDRLPPGVEWDLPRLVGAIDAAKTQVRAQMLTYRAAGWDELEAPLRRAAARGVRVQLLVADWGKRPKTLAGLRELARVPNIELEFATIPEAKRGFVPFARVIHAKLLVVDSAHAWVGTSNWERDYFYESRNVGLWIEDATLARQVSGFFERAWQSPYVTPIDPDASYTAPRIE